METDPVDKLALRYLRRRVRHLTPRYVFDRCLVYGYERRHPYAPWLTRDAISLLASLLRSSDCGLEYGAGRSTLWLGNRTRSLTSVEHSVQWFERVKERITHENLDRVHLKHIPADHRQPDDPHHADYICAGGAGLTSGSFDYALIDGIYRDECALQAVRLLKPGGILVLDNANWFVPHLSRSPNSVKTPASPVWREFLSCVAEWRLIWTTNGVWDTALWFKKL